MSCWPLEVSDNEAIVRGICSPYHLNRKGKVDANAYWPPYDSDEISTMRLDWIGVDACKQHAKALEYPVQNKVYRGLAVLSARQIRKSGADIIDTRDIFKGHSDIKHGIVPSKGDPPPPEKLKELRDRTKLLANIAAYFPDEDQSGERWSGPPLRYKE
jgi:hypothetical protein